MTTGSVPFVNRDPITAAGPTRGTWHRVLLMLGLATAFLIAWGMPRVNEDLFVSLRCGGEALSRGLTAPDASSFTREGEIFVNRGWLSHVLLFWSHSLLEEMGPLLAKGLLLFGCLALLWFRCRSLGITPDVSLLSLTLGVLGLAPFLGIRAENFGMFCFVLMATTVNGPRSWGRWRQVGALSVMILWANSHGTFVLGLGIVGLRILLELAKKMEVLSLSGTAVRDNESVTRSGALAAEKPDVLGWTITLGLALCLVAVASPFGLENAKIPFDKLIGYQEEYPWNDYRPLLDWECVFQDRLFKPFSVLPFLAFLGGLGVLGSWFVASRGLRVAVASLTKFQVRIDPFLEIAIAGMMIPLVFLWQRLILFAALSLIPPLAMLLTETIEELWNRHPGLSRWRGQSFFAGMLAFLWVLVLAVALYSSVVRLYLPGNPTSPSRQERPLVSRMVTSHLVAGEAVEFLTRNGIHGRVFSTFQSADYLLLRVPGIKVFFDLRAHVAYSSKIFREYFAVMHADARTLSHALRILEQNRVDLVVLDTMLDRRGFVLATELMTSKKWACIYKDDWIFILVPSGSARFGPAVRNIDLGSLWYPSHASRVVSESVLSFFQKGVIPDDLLSKLKSIVRERPDPDLYTLIVSAMNGTAPCLNLECKAFAQDSVANLMRADTGVAGSVPFVLESLSALLSILERSEMLCGSPAQASEYARLRQETIAKSNALLAKFSIF